MKKTILLVMMVILLSTIASAVEEIISVEGVVRDATDGTPVQSTNIDILIQYPIEAAGIGFALAQDIPSDELGFFSQNY